MWLPFRVLLLSALPAALLRGAAGFTPSLDSDFTFTLPAGRKECFYQPMPLKASLEIEYQVSEGELVFLGPGRTTWSPLSSSENLRVATEVNPGRVSWEADLLGAGVLGGAVGAWNSQVWPVLKLTPTLPLPFPLVGKRPALVTSVALLFVS